MKPISPATPTARAIEISVGRADNIGIDICVDYARRQRQWWLAAHAILAHARRRAGGPGWGRHNLI